MNNTDRVLAYDLAMEIKKEDLANINGGISQEASSSRTYKITGIQSLDFEFDN